jgi:prepilin-type N-terminal cleavage/methylation domain-containing protein
MKKTKNSQKGFTLVELLLYMGIFSILLVFLMQLFTMILDVHLESQATSSVEQDGGYILSRFFYDIHNGTDINVLINPSATVTTCTWPTSSNCQLQVAGSPTITYTINSAGNLLINGTDQLNSTNTRIASITFTKLVNTGVTSPKPSVQIIFVITSKALRMRVNPQIKTFQTTIGVR